MLCLLAVLGIRVNRAAITRPFSPWQARASIRISPDSTSVTFSRLAWGTTCSLASQASPRDFSTEPGERGTVGVEGPRNVVLRLPRVTDRRVGQGTQRAGGSARERDLIRCARRRVLAGVVAEVAQVVGRLGSGAR